MKIDCHLGMTFPLGAFGSNQFGKVDITFGDIDPELPLKEQLDKGKFAASKMFKLLLEEMARQISDMEANNGRGRTARR